MNRKIAESKRLFSTSSFFFLFTAELNDLSSSMENVTSDHSGRFNSRDINLTEFSAFPNCILLYWNQKEEEEDRERSHPGPGKENYKITVLHDIHIIGKVKVFRYENTRKKLLLTVSYVIENLTK